MFISNPDLGHSFWLVTYSLCSNRSPCYAYIKESCDLRRWWEDGPPCIHKTQPYGAEVAPTHRPARCRIFSSALCYCRLLPNLVERYLYMISPDHFLFCFVFSNFFSFHFLHFFFRFRQHGTIWEKKLHLLWKYVTDSLQKIMHTFRDHLYQSCIKNCEISNFGLFANLLFFFFVGGGVGWGGLEGDA